MSEHIHNPAHNPALDADPESHAAAVTRASDVPATRRSKFAVLALVVAAILMMLPAPELWFLDDSPQLAAVSLERAAGLANKDEYKKRDLQKVVDTLQDLITLVEATGVGGEVVDVVADMRGAVDELSARIEQMRGRDRVQPPLPGLGQLGALEGYFDGIEADNAALKDIAEARLTITAMIALLAALYLVIAPAFNRRLNAVPVFGALSGGMKVGQARALVRGVILLCTAAIVMIFQPNIPGLFPVGMGLVVLGGLVFNIVPLAQPGRMFRGVVKAGVIVAIVLAVAILLALGSAELYSFYLEARFAGA